MARTGSTLARKRESTSGERAARRAAALTIALGLAHLGWLLFHGAGSWWVFVPFFVLELWGVTQFVLRSMLTWQSVPERLDVRDAPHPDREVNLVVTCTFQTAEDLERTLVSCRSVRQASRTIVALQAGREDLLSVVDPFDVDVVVTTGNHVDAYWEAAREAEFALWLIAGQVPAPDCIEAMLPEFGDAAVAVVQAEVGMLNTDSFAHLRGGRDEEAFHSRVIQPILGSRGAASWRGGGSLVRTPAIATSGGLDHDDQAALQRATIRLQAGGWTTRYCGEPALVHSAAPDSLGAYLMLRRRTVIELLRVFRTEENPVRHPGLTVRQRLEHVALASGFASSLRQLGLTLLLTAILFTGAVPFGGSTTSWALLWIPLQLSTVRANRLLARGTMERGDWTRQAWRTLAADVNAFATVLGLRRSVATFYQSAGSGFGAIDKMRLTTTVLLLLDIAVAARGLTLIWPRLLPRFSLSGRVIALGLGLMVIVAVVDVLQVAVRRKQRRTTFRLSTDLVAIVDGELVHVVDLAVAGLGAQLYSPECSFEVGQTVSIILRIPTNAGEEQKLALDGEVRSVVEREDHHRVGISFGDLPPGVRTGLISYCAVGHHEIEGRKGKAHDVHPARFEVAASRASLTKLCSAAAVLIGLGVLLAGPAAPAALADVVAPVSVCLQSSTGEPLSEGAVSFEYDEAWHPIATTGKDGCIVGQLPATKTRVEMVHRGVRRVIRQNLEKTPAVLFSTTSIDVSLTNAAGKPIEGGVAEFRSAGEWRPIGATDAAGVVSVELLATKRTFAMTVDGVRSTQSVDLRTEARPAFSTVPVEIALRDPAGDPIAGAAAEYRGAEWISIGRTDDAGLVRTELLPGQVRFAVRHEGGRAAIRQDLAVDPLVRFATAPIVVDFRSSAGDPIAGAPVEVEADGWVDIGVTDEAGALVLEALPSTRSFRLTHEGRRQRVRQDLEADPLVRFRTIRAGVEVSLADGTLVADVPVEMRGNGWTDLGVTDEVGRVEVELLPVATRFRVRHEGVRSSFRWDLGEDPTARVSTVPTEVQVLDSLGEPIVGVDVEVRTQGWQSLGATDVNGQVQAEFVPATLRFRVVQDGTRHVVRANIAAPPVVIEVPAIEPEPDAVVAEEPVDTETTTPTSTTVQVDENPTPSTTDLVAPVTSTLAAPTTSSTVPVTSSSPPTTTGSLSSPTVEEPATTETTLSADTIAVPETTATADSTPLASTTSTTSTSTTSTSTTATSDAAPENTQSSTTTTIEPPPPEVDQAVASATVFAAPGELFESETVATALTWSSPDSESSRLLQVSLEEAAIYGSVGDGSSVGYTFRIENPSETDLADNAVIELHMPGARELSTESQEDWSCDVDGSKWRCEHNGRLLADSSSVIQVAATVPDPEVVAFVAANPTEDLIVLGIAASLMLGLLYLVMSLSSGSRDTGDSAQVG